MKESKNTPKVSVVIPTYNRGDLIGETIQSLQDQDFEDFEVRRVSLDSGISMSINSPESYGVLMAIDHGIVIDGSLAEPESALLLPGSCHLLVLTNSSPKTACFLLAFPK